MHPHQILTLAILTLTFIYCIMYKTPEGRPHIAAVSPKLITITAKTYNISLSIVNVSNCNALFDNLDTNLDINKDKNKGESNRILTFDPMFINKYNDLIINSKLGVVKYKELYIDAIKQHFEDTRLYNKIDYDDIVILTNFINAKIPASDLIKYRNVHFTDRHLNSLVHITNHDSSYQCASYVITSVATTMIN